MLPIKRDYVHGIETQRFEHISTSHFNNQIDLELCVKLKTCYPDVKHITELASHTAIWTIKS